MNINDALRELRRGRRVAREYWRGRTFIRKSLPHENHLGDIVLVNRMYDGDTPVQWDAGGENFRSDDWEVVE